MSINMTMSFIKWSTIEYNTTRSHTIHVKSIRSRFIGSFTRWISKHNKVGRVSMQFKDT